MNASINTTTMKHITLVIVSLLVFSFGSKAQNLNGNNIKNIFYKVKTSERPNERIVSYALELNNDSLVMFTLVYDVKNSNAEVRAHKVKKTLQYFLKDYNSGAAAAVKLSANYMAVYKKSSDVEYTMVSTNKNMSLRFTKNVNKKTLSDGKVVLEALNEYKAESNQSANTIYGAQLSLN